MQVKVALFLLFCLLNMFSFQTLHVEAAPETFYVSVCVDADYVLRGETLNIITITNASSFTQQIYDPKGNLIYSKLLTSNLSFVVPANAEYGTYTIKSVVGDAEATTWVTVLDVSGWKPTVFPYKRKHKGVSYTFYSNGTVFVSNSNGNFTLNFNSLVKLAKEHGLTVSATYNSMNFRARFYKTGTDIDINLVFSFIWKGCKFIVRGSVDKPRQFTFNVNKHFGTLKSMVDCVRVGNLVFDWSDLRRAKHSFTYDKETKLLTVDIPATFELDPYIFESGFETGDFSEWQETYTPSGGTVEVQSSTVNSGSYAARMTGTTTVDDLCYVRKNFTEQTTTFLRFYFRCNDTPTTGQHFKLASMFSTGGEGYRTEVRWVNDGGTLKWQVLTKTDGADVRLINSTTPTIQADTWYCVEVKRYAGTGTDGEVRLYVDGVERANKTGLDMDLVGVTENIKLLDWLWYKPEKQCFFDDVVVDTSYIGPVSSNNAPSIGEFQAPSTVYANQYFYLNATVNDADGISEIVNATVELSNSVVLKWDNATATFSEHSDPNNYCTLNASACIENELNTTAFKLSWRLKLNNYPSGTVNIVESNTKVWDGSTSANGSQASLFTFSYITLTLQARDASGNNLPFAVTFKGTLGNGTSFTVASNSAGAKALATCYGSHTVNVWWGSHLVGSTSASVTGDQTLNINTKVRKASYGSYTLYTSLNNTDLPAATVQSGVEVKFQGVTATGDVEFKALLSNWYIQDEPLTFQLGEYTYQRGSLGWGWDAANKIFTFTCHFSTKDIVLKWTTTSGGSSSPSTPSGPTGSGAEGGEEEPTAPSVPAVPESYVVYTSPLTVDTTVVAVGLIVVLCVVVLANHYLNSYGSVSKLWRKRLQRKGKVKWRKKK